MNGQPLTRGHESFHNRLERIEHINIRRQRRNSPLGRAKYRGRPVNIVQKRSKIPNPAKPTVIASLKCWSFGCLVGGALTLANTAFLNPPDMRGFAGYSADSLYLSVSVVYLLFFIVAIMGIVGMRQKPKFAQFSIALGATMILGLL